MLRVDVYAELDVYAEVVVYAVLSGLVFDQYIDMVAQPQPVDEVENVVVEEKILVELEEKTTV
jgi:hypothetical protein